MRRFEYILLSLVILNGCSAPMEENMSLNECIVSARIDASTRVSFGPDYESLDMITRWQNGDRIKTFLLTGGINRRALENPSTPIYDITEDGKGCEFSFPVPEDFNSLPNGYRLIAYPIEPESEDISKTTTRKDTPYLDYSLRRYPIDDFHVPVLYSGVVEDGHIFCQFQHLYTYEILHFSNLSDDDISFQLCGFEASPVWYSLAYSYDLTAEGLVPGVTSADRCHPVRESKELFIPAHTIGLIVSAYVPNGERVRDAYLVANINGVSFKSSNTKSSNKALQRGYAYHMYASWNGLEIKFEDGQLDMNKIQLERERVTLQTGESTHVFIENGSDGFSAVSSDDNVATAFTMQNVVNIIANGPGQCIITVSDTELERELESAELLVTVREPAVPEAVDLGLSVNWATFNLGATKPEEYGDYYAWGEIKPYYEFGEAQVDYPIWLPGKEYGYDWPSYTYCEGTSDSITKYGDGKKMVLDLNDDAAREKWGGEWRIPTKDEMDELREECIWEWTTEKGMSGVKITSKKEGYTDKYIFLPAAGQRFGQTFLGDGSLGSSWTSTADASSSKDALYFYYGPTAIGSMSSDKVYGRTIRPVCAKTPAPKVKTEAVSVDDDDISGFFTGSVSGRTLDGLVTGFRFWKDGHPDDYTEFASTQSFENEFYVELRYHDILTISHGLSVAGSYRVQAFATDENGMTGLGNILGFSFSGGGSSTPFIDLGLPSGLLWATCNLGETRPEGYGDYYAWGETEPKDNFSRETYLWCEGDGDSLTKYGGLYGFDGKDRLDLGDDAAYVNLGKTWLIPAPGDFYELISKCTWTWMTKRGVGGFSVKGPNGNSIFLPVARRLYEDRDYVYERYATNTVSSRHPEYTYSLSLNGPEEERPAGVYLSEYYDRWNGSSIRPIFFIPIESVSLNDTEVEVNNFNRSVVLSAKVYPEDAMNMRFSWDLDDNLVTIAPDYNSCTVSFWFAAGSSVLTVYADNGRTETKTATCRIVSKIYITSAEFIDPKTDYHGSISSFEIIPGESYTLTPYYYPEDATEFTSPYGWKSDDPSIATVQNGKVTGVKAGTTTIRVQYKSWNNTIVEKGCTVIVSDPGGSHEWFNEGDDWD